MIHNCRQRPTRLNGAIAAIEKCRRVSIECELKPISASGWLLICSVTSSPKAVYELQQHFMKKGLECYVAGKDATESHKSHMNDIQLSQHYDQEFFEIKEQKLLTWYPWVGDDYLQSPDNAKLLVVGESHYNNKSNQDSNINSTNECFTRKVIKKYVFSDNDSNRTFDTLKKNLCKNPQISAKNLWPKIAFYNFIQDQMHGLKKRPQAYQFLSSWKTFAKIVNILKPSACLFIGVTACNYLRQANIGDHTIIKPQEKINRTYPRNISLKIQNEESPTKIILIKHCAKYFSPELWHSYLKKNMPNEIEYLIS